MVNLQSTRSVNRSLELLVLPPSVTVQVKVPASCRVRELSVTVWIVWLLGKHVVHPPSSHSKVAEGDAAGSVWHVKLTLLNMRYSNVLVNPLTGIPAGLLIIVTLVKAGAPMQYKKKIFHYTLHLIAITIKFYAYTLQTMNRIKACKLLQYICKVLIIFQTSVPPHLQHLQYIK